MHNFLDEPVDESETYGHVTRLFEAWHALGEEAQRAIGLEVFVSRETKNLDRKQGQAIYECLRMMELFRKEAGGSLPSERQHKS